jgi:hypothetical protein
MRIENTHERTQVTLNTAHPKPPCKSGWRMHPVDIDAEVDDAWWYVVAGVLEQGVFQSETGTRHAPIETASDVFDAPTPRQERNHGLEAIFLGGEGLCVADMRARHVVAPVQDQADDLATIADVIEQGVFQSAAGTPHVMMSAMPRLPDERDHGLEVLSSGEQKFLRCA